MQKVRGPSPLDKTQIVDGLLMPCSPGDPDAIEMTWVDVPGEKLYDLPVTMVILRFWHFAIFRFLTKCCPFSERYVEIIDTNQTNCER